MKANDYAEIVWRDSAGDVHDTEVEACAASRAHQIRRRMERKFLVGETGPAEGLRWFLDDPAGIIGDYNDICLEVDKEMRTD